MASDELMRDFSLLSSIFRIYSWRKDAKGLEMCKCKCRQPHLAHGVHPLWNADLFVPAACETLPVRREQVASFKRISRNRCLTSASSLKGNRPQLCDSKTHGHCELGVPKKPMVESSTWLKGHKHDKDSPQKTGEV